MKTFRLTIYNDISEKKRRINVRAHKIENAIEIASFNHIHHASEELIKIERWDDRK
jgi:hypothetical protein